MGMNQTPSGERVHIGFFGRRNAGKSSLVNAVTGQDLAIVSEVRGTTTDPVMKAMELLPLGPVVIIDTPGIDDEGELGQKRVGKSRQVLNKTDIAILVVDGLEGKGAWEEEMIGLFEKKEIPYLVVYNKSDLTEDGPERENPHEICVSAKTGAGIFELKERMAHLLRSDGDGKTLVGDLIEPGDQVVLVVPIDKAAPKGRLILPQQQVIRDVLDHGANACVCLESELAHMLSVLKEKPKLVITDSQVFPLVAKVTPPEISMTSFSILFARYKGNLAQACRGAFALDGIQDGDKILISEGCTHHRQCGDIGTEKLPRWIREYTGKEPDFSFTSGTEFPEDLSQYRLVVHCGGCMLNEREMRFRLRSAADQGIPMTNYGILIAYMKGILKRSIAMLDIE
ncbi:MAG: [FeFe] hydrogenase H-cluster maturation GTPase HydF [Clostridium sp.]|nr:[FeFe] hydrogenase H-cluster maturation GTPase HydF [Clostridium sp.]